MKQLIAAFFFLFILPYGFAQELVPHQCNEKIAIHLGDPVPIEIEFVNKSSETVQIFWTNSDEDKLYTTLAPSKSYKQATYIGHVWKIKNLEGTCHMIFFAEEKNNFRAVIKDQNKKHKDEKLLTVPNDSASKAIELVVNSDYYASTTTGCTLEESCLNKILTAKCLVYHNDQWFTFTTSDAPVYYLIVRNQNCRDVKGVQLIVMDGIICQPASYEIVECISLASQDDIALVLKGLKKHHTYILNLDGYLNDFCKFEIRVSTESPAFHLNTDKKTNVSHRINNDSIHFNWELTEELQNSGIAYFEILRRYQTEKKLSVINVQLVERLVIGTYVTHYGYTDIVQHKGIYYYKIIAVSNTGEKFLLKEFSFSMAPVPPILNLITPDLKFAPNTMIRIEVYNWPDHKPLADMNANYVRGEFKFDLDPYFEMNNTNRLKLVFSDKKGKGKQELYVDRKYE